MVQDDLNNSLFNAAIESGRNALKSGMIINGGASLSMLTFIGSISSSINAKITIHSLAIPLGFFVAGVLACALASGATYIAQSNFYLNPQKRIGTWLNISAILLVLTSYSFFALGSYNAYQAFLNWP